MNNKYNDKNNNSMAR